MIGKPIIPQLHHKDPDARTALKAEEVARHMVIGERRIRVLKNISVSGYDYLLQAGYINAFDDGHADPTGKMLARYDIVESKRVPILDMLERMGLKEKQPKSNNDYVLRLKGSARDTIFEFIEAGENENAINLAALNKVQIAFGVHRKGPALYVTGGYLADEGYPNIALVQNDKRGWLAIHLPTGLSITPGDTTYKTKALAAAAALTNIGRLKTNNLTLEDAVARSAHIAKDQETLRNEILLGDLA